ncbi:hypothetical protein Kpol_1002p59 [Vanderwaltozyma polyspora DSM 70294]|uniref:MINDY deubiquitinase domain-containing protein n=1 Tax=Vanderwaltozyma polyspora (strain ATCC 22028 / DSM 70294 / BCRC 21397 / CBS 2163 / NBRC 10782 / NRRL Y-8283 / UCD 57-17) TaxID=436907 RepID=A7TE90_VANPO|nr:uncharacterized protein Kpol_1002p59 [Vanderwaltozyma polyspora DSM 70294]EDO19412.1 hypothetical protein Kpol_1002p59 [Vanderwaltozyma polyspora DSM 70294]
MSLSFETKHIQVNGINKKIILQNENGPCALVALTNILLISPAHAAFATDLVNFVQRSEIVSLQDLVQVLANIGIQNPNGANVDVNQLLQLLPQLHTGLNINPTFNGSFAEGIEMSLFRLYNVGIVHGWIIDPEVDPIAFQHVSRYSYEEAQTVLVQSYDISNGTLQVANPQEVLDDASYIKSFLARSATQLTEYGLKHLREVIMENSYAVLFRNDHFATIHKYNGELYTLVTDLGYKNNTNVIWQSLKSVNGSQDNFYTGQFIFTNAEPEERQLANAVSNPFSDQNEDSAVPMNLNQAVTQNNDTVEDDEELARRLQEEEDRRYAGTMQRSYQAAHENWRASRQTDSDSVIDNKKIQTKGKEN